MGGDRGSNSYYSGLKSRIQMQCTLKAGFQNWVALHYHGEVISSICKSFEIFSADPEGCIDI